MPVLYQFITFREIYGNLYNFANNKEIVTHPISSFCLTEHNHHTDEGEGGGGLPNTCSLTITLDLKRKIPTSL